MTGGTTPSAVPFADRRQAYGWLATQWSILVIGVVVWTWLAWSWLASPPTPVGIALVVVAVGNVAVMGWGLRASAAARPRVAAVADHRDLSWWRRERYGTEAAASRLGWSPPVAVGVHDGLLTAGILAMLVAVASLLAGRG